MAPRQNPIDLGIGLTDREAALDPIYRFIQGLDFNDADMVRSSMTADVTVDLSGGSSGQSEESGISKVVAMVENKIGPMATAHHVSNPRVKMLDGGKTAMVTAYGLAQHFLPGEGTGEPGRKHFTMGNYYAADVEKQKDGVWKITKFELSTLWSDGDASIMRS